MEREKLISINYAVVLRIKELLAKHNISRYRLEQNSGISHSQLGFIMKNRNNSVNFKTIIMLAQGFNMTLLEFLDSPYFDFDKLEIG